MNDYSAKEQALYKNWCLVDEQIDMRESFCGVGTRKIKVFLNQKVKKGDKIAELLRVALELNDVNVSAKRYWGDYKRDYYSKKEDLIRDLNHLYRETESWTMVIIIILADSRLISCTMNFPVVNKSVSIANCGTQQKFLCMKRNGIDLRTQHIKSWSVLSWRCMEMKLTRSIRI